MISESKAFMLCMAFSMFFGILGIFFGSISATASHKQSEAEWQFETKWLCNYISSLSTDSDHQVRIMNTCLIDQIKKRES